MLSLKTGDESSPLHSKCGVEKPVVSTRPDATEDAILFVTVRLKHLSNGV